MPFKAKVRLFRRLMPVVAFVLTAAAYILASPVAIAQHDAGAPVVPVVSDGVSSDGFLGHVMALRDPSRSLTVQDVLEPARRDAFRPVDERAPDFGYTQDVIWLRVTLRNADAGVADWRMHFRENFLQLFEVYQVAPDGSVVLREAQNERTPYASRRVPYPELTVALDLPPGATSTVLVRYWSGGSSEISFQLMTADRFDQFAARKTAKNFVYYGMLLFLDIAAIIAFLATGRTIFASYAAYAGFGLLFVMHGDGNAFQYLWPEAPGFNAFASVPLGAGLILFGGNFAREFLQTRIYHPVFDRIIIAFMILAVGLVFAAILWDAQMTKKLLVLFSFLSMVLYALSGFNAARTRFREVRFYVLAWTGAVVASALMTGRHWLGLDISEETQFDAMRLVLVLDAGLMGFAILDRFDQLKKAREQALQASLRSTERSLNLSTRLRDLEQRYAWAVELAETRERQVADVVHDLRQPLHALRLSVQAAVSGRQEAIRHVDIEETFGYLEGLVTTYLDAHVPASAAERAGIAETETAADWPLMDILDAVADVHRADAARKGLRLTVVPTSLRTDLPPLAVMRIAANLVSNAVRYSVSGRILIGLRRRPDGRARLEVHDTGPGLPVPLFDLAKQRTMRLETASAPEGAGLGLAIVADLCRKHGLDFEILPRRGGGTSLAVTLPVNRDDNGGNT